MKLQNYIAAALDATAAGSLVTYTEGRLMLILATQEDSVNVILAELSEVNSEHDILYHSIDAMNVPAYAGIFAWYFYNDCIDTVPQYKDALYKLLCGDSEFDANDALREVFNKAKHISWQDNDTILEVALYDGTYLYFSIDLLLFYSNIVISYIDTFKSLKKIEHMQSAD